MDMQAAIRTVIEKRDLDGESMRAVMRIIMTGEATPAQIGAFLTGLRMKGETIEEIAAAAQVMRELATPVKVSVDHLVDTCGTGGDARGTFNISTASALVVAAAGAHVAKHGNRSVSSRSGSFDVLEAAGVRLDLNADQVARCITEVGVGFMFAPLHHGAMKHAIGPRREMGVRTLFNVLGPLTNPAGARHQVVGVFSADLVEPLAQVLKRLGSTHVLVVHGTDGMDEISIAAPTRVAELRDGSVESYEIRPDDFGLTAGSLDAITVDSAKASLAMINEVFADQPGPARDIVVLNAGAALYAADIVDSLAAGVALARKTISAGAARDRLERFVRFTRSL